MPPLNPPADPSTDVLANLGPLARLAGVWEGDQGLDVSQTKNGPEETRYRERMTFDPMGPVVNGSQVLYALRYTTTAWPLGSEAAFHEEVGYWLYEPATQCVMRSFMVPRAVVVLAGGTAAPDADSFTLKAEQGSDSFGVLSNPFLADKAPTKRYELNVNFGADGSLHYKEDTVLAFGGSPAPFHHTDENTLKRVES